MFEIAASMTICLLIAAILGFIVGYLAARAGCPHAEGHVVPSGHEPHEHCVSEMGPQSAEEAPSAKEETPTPGTDTTEAAETNETSQSSESEVAAETAEDTETENETEESQTTDTEAPERNEQASAGAEKEPQSVQGEPASREEEPETPPAFLEAPQGEKDNLTLIKGIGKKIEQTLNDMGIFHFSQIAAWTEENIRWVDKALAFKGRIERENWVEQAKLLAEGKETEFSKRVAAGEVSSSRS
ncbi:hypothetical protein [Nitratifractor sp.]